MSKITKNELKRNELVEWLKLTAYYFKNNIKVLIITTSSIIFVVIASTSILYIKNRNNNLSAKMLDEATNVYHLGETQTGEINKTSLINSISILKNLIEKYPSSQSAALAYYYLGILNYQIGDYNQSLTYYQNFIDKYYSNMLIHTVQKNIAGIYEMQNKFIEAAKIYENLLSASDLDLKQKEALKLNLARIYELQNQPEKAKTLYSELQNNEEAQFRLSCLSDK